MGNVPPASYSTKAEQLLPTDRSSAAQDLHFDDDDYDSDFPDSTARPVPSPASQSVKFYTLADVSTIPFEFDLILTSVLLVAGAGSGA